MKPITHEWGEKAEGDFATRKIAKDVARRARAFGPAARTAPGLY